MPLKLVPPRQGKSPNWSIRGTYLGVHVDRSCKTDRRGVAAGQLRDLQARIERGEYPEKPIAPGAPTFVTAAVAYMKDRRQSRARARYIGRLIQRIGDMPLTEITQDVINDTALSMYPAASPASRNAYVYTPMSAILHHAGIKISVQRPKGALGRTVTDYMTPEDAHAIIEAAQRIDGEFALLLKFLLFTGCRVGEALALRPEDIRLTERTAWVRRSKNGRPRTLRLRDDLAAELGLRKPHAPDKFFRFRQGGGMSHYLTRSKLAVLGLPCPTRRAIGWRQPRNRLEFVNFHTFRHTWATWMRQYAGADLQGLVATGNWSSLRAAQRYSHVVARVEWERVESLPSGKSVELKHARG